MTEQQLSHYDAVNGSAESADLWRNEVQDRLARYKRRRGRRIEGAYTMRFPFPADETVAVEPSEAAAHPAMEIPAVGVEPAPAPEVACEVTQTEPLDAEEVSEV